MNTYLLLLAALLLSLGLFRRILARRHALTQSAANSIPTAEDYDLYLTAMESAFSANYFPSIPKAPRKPRTKKSKSPSQSPVSQSPESIPDCPSTDRSIPAQTAKPKDKFLGAGKIHAKTHAALPAIERSTSSNSFDEATASSPKQSPEFIRVNRCSSLLKGEPKQPRAILKICLAPMRLASICLISLLRPIFRAPKFFSSLFRRHPQPTPPDALELPTQNRAA